MYYWYKMALFDETPEEFEAETISLEYIFLSNFYN
jgi:hypothetical protein